MLRICFPPCGIAPLCLRMRRLMPNRRQFLSLGIATGSLVAAGAVHRVAANSATAGSAAAEPFSVPMPVPVVKEPDDTSGDHDLYRVAIRPATAEILPGKQTAVVTYDGQFIGPTIRARRDRTVKVEFTNQLDMPANVHLHGGHVAAEHDGFPMDVIAPGASRTYEYPNRQQAATLWYHDHSHHMEAQHVYRGLHGFYLIEDGSAARLGLPTGEYDVPILLRDARFDDTGAFIYTNEPVLNRHTLLANGKHQPYFEVEARSYRFRLLNGANKRNFLLTLGDGERMIQIGSDGGLIPWPVERDLIRLSSGERQEFTVDFSKYPVGTQLVLNDAVDGPVLRFDVVSQAAEVSQVLPDQLVPAPVRPQVLTTRNVELSFDLTGPAPVGQVNGRPFDGSRVDFTVKRGSSEIWLVSNGDPEFDHNFHMHLTQFLVLDRDGGRPLPDDNGFKDTITVPAGARNVRVLATFPDYIGRYVYHCHFLEHSSLGMMAVMEVVP